MKNVNDYYSARKTPFKMQFDLKPTRPIPPDPHPQIVDDPLPTPSSSPLLKTGGNWFIRQWDALYSNYMLRLLIGLGTPFMLFFALADWTSFTAAQLRPGEMIVSNTMVQLWVAAYRLVFAFGIAILIIGITWKGLLRFFRPDKDKEFDLMSSIKNDLPPTQRVWLFFAVLFGLAFLFVLLLSVKLPGSLSVVP